MQLTTAPAEARSRATRHENTVIARPLSIRDERLREVRLSFNLVIGLAVAGTLIFLGGIAVWLIYGSSTFGVPLSGVGGVIQLLSTLALGLYRHASKKLTDIEEREDRIARFDRAQQCAELISEPEARDKALRDLATGLT